MNTEYHKIQSVFKRDPDNNYKTFLDEYAKSEFGYLAPLMWGGTEKIDGTNVRLNFGLVRGKTDNAQLHSGLIQACLPIVANQDKWRSVFGDDYNDFTLYGEGYGAGIQKGTTYRPDKAFVLFDVAVGYEQPQWLSRWSVNDIAEQFGIPAVPELGTHDLYNWVHLIRAHKYAESLLHPGAPNEGVVLRPVEELRDKRGERIITKLKFKDFASA